MPLTSTSLPSATLRLRSLSVFARQSTRRGASGG
uniref:Uncharacterized protein n=1 Tax=Arundo donax TaxID=35708 RepID=A0A0A8ZJ56_ARUDO